MFTRGASMAWPWRFVREVARGDGVVGAPSMPFSAPKPPQAKKMLDTSLPSRLRPCTLIRLSMPLSAWTRSGMTLASAPKISGAT